MKINRILLGFSLVAILLSALAYPSLGIRNPPASAKAQDGKLVTGQLVQGQTRDVELSKHFRKYDLIRMDPHAVAAQIRNRGRLLLKSSMRDFDMQLAPHDLRSRDYSAQVIDASGVAHPLPKSEVTTFRGEVKGLPNAQVRMSLTDKGVEGAIITREKRYFLQPARAISKEARTDEFVLYDGADLNKEAGTCGVTLADQVAAQEDATKKSTTDLIDAEVTNGPVPRLPALAVVRISTDADGEYVTAMGGATQANAQIINILNLVDGIYQFEIGLTFSIVQQNTWANSATDPYTSSVAGTLLDQFKAHWNANFPNSDLNARTIAHLFTGKDLNLQTIGVAFTGAACRSPENAYGLSQRIPGGPPTITAQTAILTAHEIGHNFGGAHTNEVDEFVPFDPEPPCQNTIMEAFIGDGSSFCPFSRSQIIGHANANLSCLVDSTELPPTFPSCSTTPIAAGATANGNLSNTDCRSDLRGVDHFADRYTFNGTAGQRISIQMTAGFDAYFYLIAPDGYVLTQNDDSGGGTNSRIPSNGTITLPLTGVYIIETTSFAKQATGAYTVTLTVASCSISASPASFNFPSAGGSNSINVTLSGGGCDSYRVFVLPSTVTWVTPETTDASGTRAINFTVSPNPDSAGRRAFIMIGPGTMLRPDLTEIDPAGGLRIPVTQSGTGPNCVATPIVFGQTLNGTLANTDCHSPVRGNNFFADRYTFNATAGQRIRIQTNAASTANPDTYLVLIGPNGVVLYVDDDSGGSPAVLTNSRIPGGPGMLSLSLSGTYTIEVTEFSPSTTGSYSITLTGETPANTIQLPQATFNVGEAANSLQVNVTRSGDTSGAATANFATSDSSGLTNCTIANGNASERCDYATTVGTLRFAAGETSKTIIIPIVNDALVEGSENFILRLMSPTGASLGTSQATITINDNDAAPASQNPIDGVEFFVNQQYIDFLGRLPDSVGFANWVATLGGCPNGGFGEFDNPSCDRVHVSSGFFLSLEFQGRGYFAYRFYEVAVNRRPTYAEFVPDMAQVGGAQSPESEVLSKAAYTQEWTQRPEFKSRYDALTNQAYVDALETNAEVTVTNKAALVTALNDGTMTRGEVLRNIVESAAVENRFFIRAFVSMQYFGYLRRDPDAIGFQNWVDTLNANPSNFRHMIFGFLFSTEYRQRFGP